MDELLVQRFWAKVDRKGPDECWPWTAAIGPHGYGVIGVPLTRKSVLAHHVSYEIANGPPAPRPGDNAQLRQPLVREPGAPI